MINMVSGAALQKAQVLSFLIALLLFSTTLVCNHPIDNFFTSVPLFLDLLEKGIMATGTLRGNRKYVPRGMFAKTITKKKTLGWIDYHMHKERQVYCIVWKDKQVVLLSTHAQPISEAGVREFVWKKIGGKNKKVITGPMHL
jgi:hypothetical protein